MKNNNYTYVGVNGVLRLCTGQFHKPIDGLISLSNGEFNNPEWIDEGDIHFTEVKNWQDNYNPFIGARLLK